MPTPTTRFSDLANLKALFAGLKQKYVSKNSDATLHSLTASGEVTATEGTGASAVTHNLTEKLDASRYRGQQTWGDLRGTATWGELLGTQVTGTATTTTNLSLVKPGYDSTVDVDAFNDNMDAIDGAVGDLQDAIGDATAHAGTVTSVSAGVGLSGGTISSSGTVKASLKSETAHIASSATPTNTADRQYAVGVDADGYLSVNVPWEGGSVDVDDDTIKINAQGQIYVALPDLDSVSF